jgi:hypothetical protein
MRLTTKPGSSPAMHHFLAQLSAKARARATVSGGGEARDHLDQAHDRHRIEEVHADEARRIGRGYGPCG